MDNIYDSNNYKKTRTNIKKRAKNKNIQSSNVKKTGMIPKNYNQKKFMNKLNSENKNKKLWDWSRDKKRYQFRHEQNDQNDEDSLFSDEESLYSTKSKDPIHLLDEADRICKKPNKNKNQNKNKSDSFLSQFEDLKFNNNKNPVSQNNNDPNIKEKFVGAGSSDDMTYGFIDKNKFTHNNMVPFFSAPSYGDDKNQQTNLDDLKQRKLEDFTGSLNSLNYRPKTERKPLFNPSVGLTNIYGMPNFTNFMSQRYNPSKERRNEFPTQPVKVTPGLNLGYNEVSKQGFHDLYRALPKTTNQLRSANNPKLSYHKPIIHGKKGDKRPIIPNIAKRRPVTFFEQDPRDFVKSSSYYKAPQIRGNWDVPIPNREQTSKGYVGGVAAENSQLKPPSLLPKHKISHKEHFKNPGPMRAGSREMAKQPAFDRKSNIPSLTLRDIHQKNNYINPAGHQEGHKQQAFDRKSNVPAPTLRDIHQNQNYVGHAQSTYGQKQQAFDLKTNIPDPTLRDIHQNQNYIGQAQPTYGQKQPAFDLKTNVPDPTLRDIHQNKNYLGQAQPTRGEKPQAFDLKTNIPDPTLRDIHQNKNYLGQAQPTYGQKHQAFDLKANVPDPTLRDIHLNKNYLGQAQPVYGQKHQAFDLKANVPDPTLRDIHQNNNYVGQAQTTRGEKHQAFDRKANVPDPTLRDIHQNNNYVGQAQTTRGEKQQAFDRKANVPDPTLRDIHQNKNYIGQVQSTRGEKQQAFDRKANVPDATLRDIHQNNNYVGHAQPTHGEKQQAFDRKSNVPDPTLRDIHQNNNYVGHAQPTHGEKQQAFDRKANVPNATLRDIHQNKNYINAPGPNGKSKNYTINYKNWTPEITLREIHGKKNHLNPTGFHEKDRSRRDIHNSYVNTGKEDIINNGRGPTTANYSKGPIKETINMTQCEPIQINRELYPNKNWQNQTDCITKEHTRMGNMLPQWESIRFDTGIPEAVLKFNPYINNTQHKSVEY